MAGKESSELTVITKAKDLCLYINEQGGYHGEICY